MASNEPIIRVPTISVPPIGPAQDFVVHLPEVGTITGAILGGIIMFAYVISRFRKDNSVNISEANLYKNLSDRIETISKTLERVEAERENLLRSVAKAEGRIAELEKHEEENKMLRVRLEEKDRIIKDLQAGSEVKQAEITDLQNRIHELEMQMKQRFIDCQVCDHKKLSMEMTRCTDPHLPIEDEI